MGSDFRVALRPSILWRDLVAAARVTTVPGGCKGMAWRWWGDSKLESSQYFDQRLRRSPIQSGGSK